MSNILKRRLNDIHDDVAGLTRFARNRAEGDQWVDEQGFIELHIRCIKEQLDRWYSSYRELHPKGALPARRANREIERTEQMQRLTPSSKPN